MQFEGKVAVVTGAGQGIGEAYAKAIAEAGASVVVAEINKSQGERVADEIRVAGGDALFVEVDVASPDSTAAMAAQAIYPLVHPGEALHFEYSTTKGLPAKAAPRS